MALAASTAESTGLETHRRLYHDEVSDYDIQVTTPSSDPRLWNAYLAGARSSYRAHDVEEALGFDEIEDGRSSSLVFIALRDGEVVGGVRAQGPFTDADDAHAVSEWAGAPDQATVRSLIARRLASGVVEMKAAWLLDGLPSRRALFSCLARTPIHAAALLDARYGMGTAAGHTLSCWRAAGGVVATEVSPVRYPDDRFRTRMIWFDRIALATRLTGSARVAVDAEAQQLDLTVLPVPEPRREA